MIYQDLTTYVPLILVVTIAIYFVYYYFVKYPKIKAHLYERVQGREDNKVMTLDQIIDKYEEKRKVSKNKLKKLEFIIEFKYDFLQRYINENLDGFTYEIGGYTLMTKYDTVKKEQYVYNLETGKSTLENALAASDIFKGRYGVTDVEFSTVYFSKENPVVLRVFADFNKDFKGDIYIEPDKTEKHLGNIARTFQKWNSNNTTVFMENAEFEKVFQVQATDDQTARYVLNLKMQESLLKLHKDLNAELIVRFKDGKMLMYIPLRKGIVDIDADKALTKDLFDNVLNSFKECLQIIDDLNLNTRIWTKD